MRYSETEKVNLLVLVGLYPYRTIIDEFTEYVGEINLGSLTDRCKKYNVDKQTAIDWCLEHGVTYENYFSFIETYEKPLSRFDELKRRVGDDFGKFRWHYATMDFWSVMERYTISWDEFKFLSKKFGCKGRRRWDEKNGKALVAGYYKLTDIEFQERFDIDKDHKVVEKYVEQHREKKRLYQKKYRSKQETN